jgi:hypothetical protein
VTKRLLGALIVSLILVGYGLLAFDRPDELSRSSLPLGLGFLTLSIAAIMGRGWRGNARAWPFAAGGAAIEVWVLYEGMRRGGCGLDETGTTGACFPDLGPLAGLILGGAALALILAIGSWRIRRLEPPDRPSG